MTCFINFPRTFSKVQIARAPQACLEHIFPGEAQSSSQLVQCFGVWILVDCLVNGTLVVLLLQGLYQVCLPVSRPWVSSPSHALLFHLVSYGDIAPCDVVSCIRILKNRYLGRLSVNQRFSQSSAVSFKYFYANLHT